MSMMRQDFDDQDAQAAWELLGRHRPIEPSFGFAERTLRRLHEAPARQARFWELPGWRWATALSLGVILGVAGWVGYRQTSRARSTEVAELLSQDLVDDYDVIASLHQLEGDPQL